jgi:hypothetical protein
MDDETKLAANTLDTKGQTRFIKLMVPSGETGHSFHYIIQAPKFMSCSPFGIAHVLAPCTTLTKKELYL